jgi:hypothetical protein
MQSKARQGEAWHGNQLRYVLLRYVKRCSLTARGRFAGPGHYYERGHKMSDILTTEHAASSMKKRKTRVNEICELHNEICALLKTSLDKGIRIGQLLSEQKEGFNHGEWLPWIRANLPFTPRTAQSYMRLYSERDRLKSENVSHLADAYRMLESPKPTGRYVTIDSRDIELNPFFEMSYLVPESVKWWVNAIQYIGLYWTTAVRLNCDKYQNISDHNRFVAIKTIGARDVPVVIVPGMDDKKMKSVLEQFDYQEFHQYELYKRLPGSTHESR